MSYIFSFSSRNSAFRFLDAVVAGGCKAKLVNAPIRNGEGCGLAVKCDNYKLCQDVLNSGHYANLRAVYSYDGDTYKTIYNIGN
ncbi:MAG: DUF3343 domain-containing protein [Clostridiales bacterium]|nr:DUF3343 domain-containing protein [Clostridiales bacterium]